MESPSYRFLDRADDIRTFLGSLDREGALAIDLEADSLHSYREKACLVQISTPSGNTILDPLPDRTALAGLGPLLESEAVDKVFHGGDYDLRLLKRDFGFQVRNVFDTMIAAQLLGREQFGLAALLSETFGVALDKKYQRADWSARPLRSEFLAYASLDTAYLLGLREKLEAELSAAGRLHWAREEFRLLERVEPSAPRAPSCFDVKGAGRLEPRQLALLQRLLEARDELSRAWDRPPFKVVSTELLLDWAQKPPASRKAVLEARGASKPALSRLAVPVLEAAKAACGLSLEDCPRPLVSAYVPLTGSEERRLKRLKRARALKAEALRLSPGLLVNSATLERLARMPTEEAAAALPQVLKAWQREVLGEELADALEGREGGTLGAA
ncbi:MAG: HRDC domain-containing protein [Deltaproteobacteria bacterium]|nr:HRDC domain-containing protein [Deltaproteobacteria bacterium]